MIELKKILQPSIGDEVIIKSNINNHTLAIGSKHTIIESNGDNHLLAHTAVGIDTQTLAQGARGIIQHNYGNWVSMIDLSIEVNKDKIISDLSNILEFLKDYENDIVNTEKVVKEFKVYHILKEVKSSKTDFEKIDIISKYL